MGIIIRFTDYIRSSMSNLVGRLVSYMAQRRALARIAERKRLAEQETESESESESEEEEEDDANDINTLVHILLTTGHLSDTDDARLTTALFRYFCMNKSADEFINWQMYLRADILNGTHGRQQQPTIPGATILAIKLFAIEMNLGVPPDGSLMNWLSTTFYGSNDE
jgi:hypothetical protein